MKKHNVLKIALLSFLFIKCSIKPQAINYGKDTCHHCKMTVIDKVHGAEIVSKKGKVIKFDAIECMLRFMNNVNLNEYSLFLINELEVPENLIDATKAYYLVSENLRSPMGGNLSGFSEKEKAQKYQIEKGGQIYTWEEIQEKF